MLCKTCPNDIEQSTWRLQCIECYKNSFKNCMLCNKKKMSQYLFCYECNSTKKEECHMALKEQAENDLCDFYEKQRYWHEEATRVQ